MGWQPGQEPGGEAGAEPGPRPDAGSSGAPGPGPGAAGVSGPGVSGPGVSGPSTARAALLAGFACGGEWETRPPSAALAVALEEASGGEWRCPDADHDALIGLLRQWTALESWAAAAKLGVLRALMREEDMPPLGGHHGDLPDGWTKSLTHEVALALGLSAQGADTMMWVAWDLQARTPGIGRLLADGTLSYGKVRALDDELNQVTDTAIEEAERLVLAQMGEADAVKSFSQLVKIAAQAAVTVEPDAAARRRKAAEETRARVDRWRERSGAAALSGRDLPTDQTLAAYANVTARAEEYKASDAFTAVRMDQLRALAYLDLLNGVPAQERIAHAQAKAEQAATEQGTAGTGADETAARAPSECSCRECDGRCVPADDEDLDPADDQAADDQADDDQADDDQVNDGHGGDRNRDSQNRDDPDRDDSDGDGSGPNPRGGGPGPNSPGPNDAGPGDRPAASLPDPSPRLSDLVIPLATLLGLAERPGEGHGLGPFDPDLCRDLAARAASSPHSQFCVTVTDQDGITIGHGCAGPSRKTRTSPDSAQALSAMRRLVDSQPAFPARVNLTIMATQLTKLAGIFEIHEKHGSSGALEPLGWTLTPRDDPGPPDGYGTWTLTLPGGRELNTTLHPVPTFDCDHRNESRAYQPNGTLRHLVQIRDYECTLPVCSRHARESDFEHAIPYDKGGRTCACNAGTRSRQCHRIKQSPGWNVTQPRPGWHQWQTPSGRVYTQAPKQYPV